MPNHVTNRITLAAEHADMVLSEVVTEDCLDFNKLVPRPPHMYHGDLSMEDEKDFPCNWQSWQCENWGTKWDAYEGKVERTDNQVRIYFDTAWSTPYPIISAFCNRFQIPFTHEYFDEGHNFWGIEEWGQRRYSKEKCIVRIDKRRSHPDDEAPLCLELKGVDMNADEEDEEATA